MNRQLALPFAHAPRFAPEAFLPGPGNEEARAWLDRPAAWPGGRLLIWGDGGVGKTHLLHSWAAARQARLLAAPDLRSRILPLPPQADLAIDDADATADPVALLHVLNAAAEGGQHVLLAARTPPARWGAMLPDLGSRLRATLAVAIRPPDDTLLRALLAQLLAERQMAVPEPLQDWLRLRLPRAAWAMREAASRLDRLALAQGGRIGHRLLAHLVAQFAADGLADASDSPCPGDVSRDDIFKMGHADASPGRPALL